MSSALGRVVSEVNAFSSGAFRSSPVVIVSDGSAWIDKPLPSDRPNESPGMPADKKGEDAAIVIIHSFLSYIAMSESKSFEKGWFGKTETLSQVFSFL